MTYQEALDFISRQGRFAMKLGTERTRALLDQAGKPDAGLRGALIAGTNGKGSTGACLSAILRAAGHDTGFMPKPHLISYTERIEVNGTPISEADFVATLEQLGPAQDVITSTMGPPTEFEMLTVMAVAYIAARAELLVCEVGLGGRLDATNTLDLGVAVITNVALDHQKYLGDTIGEIAREKAAIIKHRNHVVTGCEGEALEIVEARAASESAEVWRLGHEIRLRSKSLGWSGFELSVTGPGFDHRDLRLPLLGDYQPANAALAVAAAHLITDVSDEAVRAGLAATRWPGRLQVIGERPRVIVDGGHNPAALQRAGAALRALIGSDRLVAVFGMLSERDPAQLLGALRTLRPDAVVFTEPASAHGHVIEAERLAGMYGEGASAEPRAGPALERAEELAGPGGNVLVCGSLYLVGEVLELRSSPAGSARRGRRSPRSSGSAGRARTRPKGVRR
ncbi:MAG TPA: Mur ligase family protein [Candidatus Dormibacteraeota bacterium]|nr:Mur ligase family protein [Candidatus Dormibacteraeota bacterium]